MIDANLRGVESKVMQAGPRPLPNTMSWVLFFGAEPHAPNRSRPVPSQPRGVIRSAEPWPVDALGGRHVVTSHLHVVQKRIATRMGVKTPLRSFRLVHRRAEIPAARRPPSQTNAQGRTIW